MISIEDIRIYLPKYLSPESEGVLFNELKRFPENIDDRMYSSALQKQETIFQGDGVRDLLVINLPDTSVRPAPCMIISNTCDIDPKNERHFHSKICYTPILNLEKYQRTILERGLRSEDSLHEHFSAIRSQRVTQIFYLPKCSTLEYEGFVFFDRICNMSNDCLPRSEVPDRRLFALSDYGAWLFLLKLSIHFTRLTDRVDRLKGSFL